MFLAFLEKSENLRENLKNVGYVQGGQVMDFKFTDKKAIQ